MSGEGSSRELAEVRAIVDRTFLVRRITLAVFCAVALVVLGVPGFPFNPVFAVPFAWLLLTLPFHGLLRRQRTLRALQNVHAAFLAAEALLVSYLVHRLGGVEWIGVVFYLFTVVYANFFLPRWAAYAVTGVAVGGYAAVAFLQYLGVLPHIPFLSRPGTPPHRDPAYVVATVLVGGVGFYAVLAFTARAFAGLYARQAEALRARERALARLSAELLSAGEAERRRIARHLHDELGQELAAARWAIAAGDRDGAERILARAVEAMRTLARELRPPLLDELGLGPALRALGERVSRATGLPVDVDVPEDRFPPEVEVAAFRVVQEAVENARRHSGARRVTIRIGRVGENLVGEVADDGRGVPAPAGGGLGLPGMEEWVRSLGGELVLRSAPGRGTTVRFTIPIHGADPDR
ncbi:MAG: sensor histidine kinase [Candidatus Bipolaricaulota bacterium]|nr:sensor histidine kinase [Candidatus Bipolaricaulota bacterium]